MLFTAAVSLQQLWCFLKHRATRMSPFAGHVATPLSVTDTRLVTADCIQREVNCPMQIPDLHLPIG
ncbi:MAG: hypothetical protein R2873_04140 [Caldilineaceae bacterium]